jgi:hypothetical protein
MGDEEITVPKHEALPAVALEELAFCRPQRTGRNKV